MSGMEIPLFISLIFTSLAAYTDIRRKIIPNKITYPMIAFGIIYHGVSGAVRGEIWEIFAGALGAIAAFILGIALYSIGGWAGGDVKLFTGLGALLPFTTGSPYPLFISVLFNSVILTVFSLPFFAIIRRRKGIFYQTVHVDDLKEGMIPAETIAHQGKVYGDPKRAAGLTRYEVREIKRLAHEGKIPKRIRVKIGTPFAPILFAGLVLAVIIGDIYWALISRFLEFT